MITGHFVVNVLSKLVQESLGKYLLLQVQAIERKNVCLVIQS